MSDPLTTGKITFGVGATDAVGDDRLEKAAGMVPQRQHNVLGQRLQSIINHNNGQIILNFADGSFLEFKGVTEMQAHPGRTLRK